MTHTQRHTPGPWIAYNAQGGRIFKKWRIHRAEARVIAEICENNSTEIEAANARLISAAPDLLAATRASEAILRAILDGDTAARAGWSREYVRGLMDAHKAAMDALMAATAN